MSIKLRPPHFENSAEILFLAKLHENMPNIWSPGFQAPESQVQLCAEVILKSKENPRMFLLIAEDEKLVGFHWLELREEYGDLCAHSKSLWVDPEHRKQGLGTQMKKEGEKWAQEKGARFMHSYVYYNNKKMISFNEKLGFLAGKLEMIKEL